MSGDAKAVAVHLICHQQDNIGTLIHNDILRDSVNLVPISSIVFFLFIAILFLQILCFVNPCNIMKS